MRFRLSSETLEILTSHIRFAKILVNVVERQRVARWPVTEAERRQL